MYQLTQGSIILLLGLSIHETVPTTNYENLNQTIGQDGMSDSTRQSYILNIWVMLGQPAYHFCAILLFSGNRRAMVFNLPSQLVKMTEL